ncbi:hypothetical protein FQN60_009701, partial [Etheostoma spectabile]
MDVSSFSERRPNGRMKCSFCVRAEDKHGDASADSQVTLELVEYKHCQGFFLIHPQFSSTRAAFSRRHGVNETFGKRSAVTDPWRVPDVWSFLLLHLLQHLQARRVIGFHFEQAVQV